MRTRTTLAAFGATCISLIAVAGCGGSTVNGTPTPGPVVPTTSALPHSGAPAVSQPLDTKSIDKDPCTVATSAQVAALAGGAIQDSAPFDSGGHSTACGWNLVDGRGLISGGTLPQDPEGLSSAYAQHAAGTLKQFLVVPPIDGYPAVVATNAPRDGYCVLRVGLRNNITYLATADMSSLDPHYSDPCTLATAIADLTIRHLKGA